MHWYNGHKFKRSLTLDKVIKLLEIDHDGANIWIKVDRFPRLAYTVCLFLFTLCNWICCVLPAIPNSWDHSGGLKRPCLTQENCMLWHTVFSTRQGYFFKCWVVSGGLPLSTLVLKLYLELIKAQHSWILWPMVKCLLWWSFALDYYNQTKFMWVISKCRV